MNLPAVESISTNTITHPCSRPHERNTVNKSFPTSVRFEAGGEVPNTGEREKYSADGFETSQSLRFRSLNA